MGVFLKEKISFEELTKYGFKREAEKDFYTYFGEDYNISIYAIKKGDTFKYKQIYYETYRAGLWDLSKLIEIKDLIEIR
jgi:hypothetical protein